MDLYIDPPHSSQIRNGPSVDLIVTVTVRTGTCTCPGTLIEVRRPDIAASSPQIIKTHPYPVCK